MILVFGATGTVGRHLVAQLVDAGQPVRAVTRNPRTADLPPSVDVRFGDLDRPQTLEPALADGPDVFLLNADYPADELVAALAAGGVRRVVFQSALVAATRPSTALAQAHLRTEKALQASDLSWTILRPGAFASNTLQWLPMIAGGTIYAPFADVATPTIDPYDIAAVAARVLTDTEPHRHEAMIYPLTGPVISPRQRAAVVAQVLDREIGFVALSPEQARQQLIENAPAAMVDSLLELLGEPSEVEREELPTVEHLLGRPPRDFTTWAATNRDALTGGRR